MLVLIDEEMESTSYKIDDRKANKKTVQGVESHTKIQLGLMFALVILLCGMLLHQYQTRFKLFN